MTLEAVITPDRVLPKLRATDKGTLLGELARRAGIALGLPAWQIADALTAREALGSTGVGTGIAVPHARLEDVQAPVGFFVSLQRPIDWSAIDGRPVDLIFLLLSPAANGAHLTALAAVSRRLRDPLVAEGIRAARNAASIRALLLG